MLEQSLAAHFNNGSIAPPETAAASRLDALVQVHVASAEFPVRRALPRPDAHLLCNRQVLRVVVDGLAEVPLQLIRDAEVSIRPALPRPVAHLLCNRKAQREVLDGLAEVPLG